MTGMFVADDKVADVQVKGPTALYLFAKTPGQTSVYATDKSGAVIWSTDVRVGNNLTGVQAMLCVAMPENDITATRSIPELPLFGRVGGVVPAVQRSLIGLKALDHVGQLAPRPRDQRRQLRH